MENPQKQKRRILDQIVFRKLKRGFISLPLEKLLVYYIKDSMSFRVGFYVTDFLEESERGTIFIRNLYSSFSNFRSVDKGLEWIFGLSGLAKKLSLSSDPLLKLNQIYRLPVPSYVVEDSSKDAQQQDYQSAKSKCPWNRKDKCKYNYQSKRCSFCNDFSYQMRWDD